MVLIIKVCYLCFFICVFVGVNSNPLSNEYSDEYNGNEVEVFKVIEPKNEKKKEKVLFSVETRETIIEKHDVVERREFEYGDLKRKKRSESDGVDKSGRYKEITNHERPYFVVKIVSDSAINERTALRDPNRLWDGHIVPYVLSDEYRQSELDVILRGIEDLQNETCLTFKQREAEPAFITIAPGAACSAVLGAREGPNRIMISENCYEVGIVQHEIMHIFGFLHEQSRPDRDDFVTVVWDNIAERHRVNFDKKSWDEVQVFGQPYDYGSVMHYARFEFAINRSRPTIIPLQENVEIGQRRRFSPIDLIKLNTLFNCSGNE